MYTLARPCTGLLFGSHFQVTLTRFLGGGGVWELLKPTPPEGEKKGATLRRQKKVPPSEGRKRYHPHKEKKGTTLTRKKKVPHPQEAKKGTTLRRQKTVPPLGGKKRYHPQECKKRYHPQKAKKEPADPQPYRISYPRVACAWLVLLTFS